LKREITDLKRANQEYSRTIAAIVEAAANYFNETIETPADLYKILSETVREEPAMAIQVRRERRLRKAAERRLRDSSKQIRLSVDSAMSEFERELRELQERAENEMRVVAERDAEIQSLKELLEREKAKRSRVEAPPVKTLEAELTALRSQNSVLSAKFSELEGRFVEVRQQNSELTARAIHTEETHRRLKTMIEESHRQIEQLATELQQAEKRGVERDGVESQLNAATSKVQQIQAELKQNEMKLSDARNSIEKLSGPSSSHKSQTAIKKMKCQSFTLNERRSSLSCTDKVSC
jgi:chromosome segregation ATPase